MYHKTTIRITYLGSVLCWNFLQLISFQVFSILLDTAWDVYSWICPCGLNNVHSYTRWPCAALLSTAIFIVNCCFVQCNFVYKCPRDMICETYRTFKVMFFRVTTCTIKLSDYSALPIKKYTYGKLYEPP